MNETRQRIVNAARGALRTKPDWRYAEVRPIPFQAFDQLLDGHGGTVTTDCSGLATCCYHRAGASDPNNEGYNGLGFTGTMLGHLPAIPLDRAQPGDLVVFGSYPGKHVVVIVGTGQDPACISHGGPGDPKEAPLSHFLGIGPITVLRGVPRVPITRKRRRAKWVVTGDHGQVIGHVHTTTWLWWARHRQVVKNQTEHRHFDRVHPAKPGESNPAIAEQ